MKKKRERYKTAQFTVTPIVQNTHNSISLTEDTHVQKIKKDHRLYMW